jgi:hypothetical protein
MTMLFSLAAGCLDSTKLEQVSEPPPPPAPLVVMDTSPSPEPVAPTPLAFTMSVSDDLREDFVLLDSVSVPENTFDALFVSMREEGDRYCSMVVDYLNDPEFSYDRTVASAFISETSQKEYSWCCRGCACNVKAGCWNFYRMNDKHPEDDFALVKQRYPSPAGFDCYAVGQVQPYMMHNVLGCDSLTTVDFDWRIQDVHFQLLQAYRADAIGDRMQLEETLGAIQVGWTAFVKEKSRTDNGSLRTFCSSGQLEECVSHLLDFQDNLATLRIIQLDLAGTHQIHWVETPPEMTRVLFLSNAMEPIYTSAEDFDAFMHSLEGALAPGQKAVLIHHVGSYRHFGLYEAKLGDEGLELQTVCRDPYNATMDDSTEPFYDTYMDDRSVTVEPVPRCHALLENAEP